MSRLVLPPRRVIALVVMALLAGGLVWLRFAPGQDTVSVPEGARAGDLVLSPCRYETEDGPAAADCGTLVVPENRADPQSRLIALPVVRLRAQSDSPAEPLFYLEGGPGITNVEFPQAGRYTADRDVVLVGYRGVDGSVRLDCPEVLSVLKRSTDLLSDATFRASGDALAACADRLSADGVDLAGYGMAQQVDDLEAARVALGYDRIHLLSQSAGTRIAMIYAWRHPESIHRSVMVGVNPPGNFLWDPRTMDEQIRRYADYCAQDADCSRRTEDLTASMQRTAADMPDRWLFLPVNDSSVRVFSFYGLMESSSQTPPSAPMTLDAWLSAAAGDASGFWALSLAGDLLPIPFAWGQYAAAGRVDAAAAREYFAEHRRDVSNLGWVGSAFAWGGGQTADRWPAVLDEDAYRTVRPSEAETLLIGGELDTSTPPQVATDQLLPSLPNGHEVVIPGLGHTLSFFAEQPEAGTHLINTFLASGDVDDSRYGPQVVDFAPGITLPTIAKVIAAIVTGLALVTVLTLLLVWRRVHTRGSLGTTASTAVRTVAPAVLGLGGWCLGVLVALVAFPAVPPDDQALVAVSVGAPTALAVFGGWVHRQWPFRVKITGLTAAVLAALFGGWLGFHATDGLLAVGATIIGATIGANLALIVLDVHDQRRRRPAATPTTPPSAPAAVPGPRTGPAAPQPTA